MKKAANAGASYDEFDVGGNYRVESHGWYNAPNRSQVLFPSCFLYTKRWGSHEMRHHQYICVALEFVVEGSATFQLDGRKTKVFAGEIFIMQRGHDSGFSTTADEHYEKMTLCISGSIPDLLLESLHLNTAPKITLLHPEEAQHRFHEIGRMLKEKVPGTENLITEKMFSLFLFLGEENKKNAVMGYPEPLQKVLELLQGGYTRGNVGISSMAEFAGVSTPTLIRMFHKFCGKSPMDYITEMRMELAKNLLEATFLSVKEISARVGYNDSLYFSTAFRKYTGMSPRNFRKLSGRETNSETEPSGLRRLSQERTRQTG